MASKILFVFLVVLSVSHWCTASPEPTGPTPVSACQWLSGSADAAALRCQLRTLQPAEWEAQMSRVAHPERAQSLRIECSDVLFFESALERQILRRMPRLRTLSIAWCKVREIQAGSLAALSDLRSLSIRTHNTDWPAMALTLSDQSLAGLRELGQLDLSDNSLISIPDGLFCSLSSLSGLNLSSNRLQDVSWLGFRATEDVDGDVSDCLQELTDLDLSHNAISQLHPLSFRALRKLQSLSVQHNGLIQLADQSLSGLESLRTLNLSSNGLSVLPPDLFRDCHELRELDLHANSLSVLPVGSFGGLSQLQALDLSANALTPAAVHRDTFAGLLRLVVLNLGRNALTRLDAALFRDLASLQVLRLDSNLIETVDPDAFLPLFNLHTLDLSRNRINTLGDRLLGGLFVLSSLSLAHNHIHSVSRQAFRNVSGLRDLDLSGNSLSLVPEALSDLSLLKSLDLSSNRISRAGNFSSGGGSSGGWGQLYSLNLADNDIRTLSKENLSGLSNLVALNLAGNKIQQLEAGCFDRTSGLQVLRLDGNQLTDVNGLFAGLHNLRWLNVSANRIGLFDYSFLPAGIEWLDIHQNGLTELGNYFQIQLAHLQAIDASFNRLGALTADALPDAAVQLFLNNNRITSIGANTFLKKANLSRVDLNSNRLRTLEPAALWLSPVPAGRDLPEFSLGDNPWRCDCHLEWLPPLVQPSSSARQQPRLVDAADMTCTLTFQRRNNSSANPIELDDAETDEEDDDSWADGRSLVPLVDVRPEEFLCSYQTHCFALCHCCDFDACDCEMTCPSGCSCYHDPTWSANIVDCSAAAAASSGDLDAALQSSQQLPEGIPMDVTELYLDGNNLSELASHAFIGRKNLRALYLNGSRIQTLRNRTFHGLGALQVLRLSDNQLEEIRGSEFEPLDHLRELYLDGNRLRWIADTAFVHLRALQLLRLDGNGLVTFPLWRLSANPHLQHLRLSANPWSCECRFLSEFHQWIGNHPERMDLPDQSDLYCLLQAADAHSQRRVIPFQDFNRSCSSSFSSSSSSSSSASSDSIVTRQVASVLDYLPLLVAGIVLAVLLLAGMVLILLYRQTLRIWIFSRYKIRLCDSTENRLSSASSAGDSSTGSRKHPHETFDAFLSYSLKDEQFVSQVLAAELEHGAESFRLCLQHRDFPSSSSSGGNTSGCSSEGSNSMTGAGDPLTLGLAASRRIILVISQSFVESEWTRPEVRTALTGFLRKPKTGQMVAVLLSASSSSSAWADAEADAELNLLLASAVRIRWGERNFWPKIRYYLPDPTPRHYIRNLHSGGSAGGNHGNAGSGMWFQTSSTIPNKTATLVDASSTIQHKRTSPHPLPLEDKSAKGELYWEIGGGHPGLPRRYTSTPQHQHHHCYSAWNGRNDPACSADEMSLYSGAGGCGGGQSYSRLEHSYMSIDHGHEHIYSCVQDPQQPEGLHHPHHPDCWTYRSGRCPDPSPGFVHPHQQQQQFHQHYYPAAVHQAGMIPRPPVQHPEFRMTPQQQQQQQHSTFLV